MKRLILSLIAIMCPAIALAELDQTTTLSISNSMNLDLDTGATPSSGGDIQYSASGITPQGNATAVNAMIFATATKLNDLIDLEVSLYPGYSNAELPSSTLKVGDLFYVKTNGSNYSALLVTATTGSTITLMFRTFGVSGGSGGTTTGAPAVTAIRNNSSGISAGLPNYGIAPSSIFVVSGTGLADPGTPELQDSSQAGGIPLSLNGASISVTVNGVTTHPGIYYTSPTQIAAVLPASTPIGTGTLTVTYDSVASKPAPILVVPAALGINSYYTNSAVATDAVTGALLTYTNSGRPGEIITLWTTGLGADPADNDTTYTSTPHAVNTPLQVYIGGTPATILYQGSAGYPGVDQINVTIPDSTPSGCWIAIAGVSGGALSNVTTIPVANSGGVCEDPVNNLSGNQLAPSNSQTIRTGFVAVQANTRNNLLTNYAEGVFESYTGLYAPSYSVSPGACIINPNVPATTGVGAGLDPGTITLTGPNGLSLTLPSQLGIKGAFSATLSTTAIPETGGTFTVKGSGGADVGSFTSVLEFSNPLLSWTNPGVATTVDRSQNLTVTWTGGNAGSYVFVTGVSTSKATSTTPSVEAGFTCLAAAGDGKFTVPSYILSALPAGTGGVGMQNDFQEKLSASGLDISFALGEVSFSSAATFN